MMFLDEIKCLLEEDHSRKQTNTIVNFVGDDKKKMKALMSFFLDNKWEWRFNQWAAWPVGYIGRKYPKLIIPYFEDLIRVMDNPSHNAVLRNTIRILEDIEVPEKYEGEIYQRCFVFLNDPDQPIAIRCFSMSVVFNIAKKYPDLKNELIASLELHMPYGSAGFKSRGNKILNYLSK